MVSLILPVELEQVWELSRPRRMSYSSNNADGYDSNDSNEESAEGQLSSRSIKLSVGRHFKATCIHQHSSDSNFISAAQWNQTSGTNITFHLLLLVWCYMWYMWEEVSSESHTVPGVGRRKGTSCYPTRGENSLDHKCRKKKKKSRKRSDDIAGHGRVHSANARFHCGWCPVGRLAAL